MATEILDRTTLDKLDKIAGILDTMAGILAAISNPQEVVEICCIVAEEIREITEKFTLSAPAGTYEVVDNYEDNEEDTFDA